MLMYRNPQQATQALLHGIIADGIINVGRPIDHLVEIQSEVGLPANSLTAGQSYALQTYGIDGWGREFRLAKADSRHTVTSAGPDGRFDTADDMSVTVKQCQKELLEWSNLRQAYFIRKVGEDYLMFNHRWKGKFFLYNNEHLARRLTGDVLFDVLTAKEINKYGTVDDARTLRDAYDRVTAASGVPDPLVLCLFSDSP